MPPNLILRARIVLMAGEGHSNRHIAQVLHVRERTVGKWRRQFVERGVAGLLGAARTGAPRSISEAMIERAVRLALSVPSNDGRLPSSRCIAEAVGVSQSSVVRLLRSFGLTDRYRERVMCAVPADCALRRIVGLYADPPSYLVGIEVYAVPREAPTKAGRPPVVMRARGTGDYLEPLFSFWQSLEARVPRDGEVHVVAEGVSAEQMLLLASWARRRPAIRLHL